MFEDLVGTDRVIGRSLDLREFLLRPHEPDSAPQLGKKMVTGASLQFNALHIPPPTKGFEEEKAAATTDFEKATPARQESLDAADFQNEIVDLACTRDKVLLVMVVMRVNLGQL
jgi:hypothetical protein